MPPSKHPTMKANGKLVAEFVYQVTEPQEDAHRNHIRIHTYRLMSSGVVLEKTEYKGGKRPQKLPFRQANHVVLCFEASEFFRVLEDRIKRMSKEFPRFKYEVLSVKGETRR